VLAEGNTLAKVLGAMHVIQNRKNGDVEGIVPILKCLGSYVLITNVKLGNVFFGKFKGRDATYELQAFCERRWLDFM
jgi:hypothetical protein